MSVESHPDSHDHSTPVRTASDPPTPSIALDGGREATTEPPPEADTRDLPESRTPELVTTAAPRGPTDASRLRHTDPCAPEDQSATESCSPSIHSGASPDNGVREPPATDFVSARPAAEADEQRTIGETNPDDRLEAVRERILADAVERADRQFDEVCAVHGVETPEGIAAIRKARNILAETAAPFCVEGAHRIRDGLRDKIAEWPDAVVPITYRDGLSIGKALEEIDPELYEAHCRPVHISRVSMEGVLQNLENQAGRKFPELEKFRDRSMADPDEVPGAALRGARHLIDKGLPITTPGAHIIFVDSGTRGTIQEAVAAAWPKPVYSGEYLYHVESEHDPHKGTKNGHFLHLSPDRVHPPEPDDPARIYADKTPGIVFEHLLHGTMSTTYGHDDGGNPVHATEYPSVEQINPLAIAPEYSDPNVRLAIMDIAPQTVANHARTVAELGKAGIDYRPDLAEQARAYTLRVRSWAYGGDPGDPAFNELADSFVRRDDKNLVPRLRTAISDLDEVAATAVWRDYRKLSLTDKERYVEQFERTALSSGSNAPEGRSDG